MSVERLKSIKDALMCAIESQIYDLANVDAEELGEVVDMVKDMEEAIYYCTVVKAMEEGEEKKSSYHGGEERMYYSPYYMKYPQSSWSSSYPMEDDYRERMYYNEGNTNASGSGGRSGGSYSGSGGSSNGGSSGGRSGGGQSSAQYSEREFPDAFQDSREGKSYRSRRMYMEAKETNQDKTAQMRELERYVQELTSDIVDMIQDASPEEKQYLSKKIAVLANKVTQTNDQH